MLTVAPTPKSLNVSRWQLDHRQPHPPRKLFSQQGTEGKEQGVQGEQEEQGGRFHGAHQDKCRCLAVALAAFLVSKVDQVS